MYLIFFQMVELANIDSLVTPLEKMAAMKTTLDLISEGVNAHLFKNSSTEGEKQMHYIFIYKMQ